MEVKVKCPICNAVNDLKKDERQYTYQRKVLIDNCFYYLTSFVCECGKIICVQVDDDNTIKLLREEQSIVRKAMQKKKNKKKISSKITEEQRKKKMDLDNARMNLMRKLDGKQANIFGTTEWFEVRFVLL